MSKEVFGKKLNAGQRSGIVGGIAENAANVTQIKKVTSSAPSPGFLSATSGSLLMAGGFFTTIKAYKLMRDASNLRLEERSIEKALDETGVILDKAESRALLTNIKKALADKDICNNKGFVKSAARKDSLLEEGDQRGKASGEKFKNAIEEAILGFSAELGGRTDLDKLVLTPDNINAVAKSLAQDLGFVCREYKDEIFRIESYDPGIHDSEVPINNVYKPDSALKGTNPTPTAYQQKQFLYAMEASGIIDSNQIVKVPSRSDLQACCKVAGIEFSEPAYFTETLEGLQKQAKSVAIVPSWNDSVNMNKKREAGFVGLVGLLTVVVGAIGVASAFSGLGGLAPASLVLTATGMAIGSTLTLVDLYREADHQNRNNNLKKTHGKLKQEALSVLASHDLKPEQREKAHSQFIEHDMQEKLYQTKARENIGMSVANVVLLASVTVAIISTAGLFGSVSMGMISLAAGSSFIAGTGIMVGTKKIFGREVDHIERDLKKLENLEKSKAEEKQSEVVVEQSKDQQVQQSKDQQVLESKDQQVLESQQMMESQQSMESQQMSQIDESLTELRNKYGSENRYNTALDKKKQESQAKETAGPSASQHLAQNFQPSRMPAYTQLAEIQEALQGVQCDGKTGAEPTPPHFSTVESQAKGDKGQTI